MIDYTHISLLRVEQANHHTLAHCVYVPCSMSVHITSQKVDSQVERVERQFEKTGSQITICT